MENALALAIRPPDFDASKPLLAASQLRSADTQNQLAQMQLQTAGERRNDLAAYKSTGDIESLRGQPDIYAQIVQTRNSLDENKRKQFDFTLLQNARGAQRVAAIADPGERARAWKEELGLGLKEGRIDQNSYQRLVAAPPNDLMLRNVILGGTSIENAITLEQKEKDRAAGLDFSRGLGAALGGQPAPAAAPTGSMFGGLQGWAPGERPMEMGPAPGTAPAASPAPGAAAAAPNVPAAAAPVAAAPPAPPATDPSGAPAPPIGAKPATPVVGDVTTRLHALIPQLAMAMGNPGLPKETREQAGKLLDTALSDSKATEEQKNYYNSYVPQEIAAGRTPLPIFEWQKQLKAAGRNQITIDQRGESKLTETLSVGLGGQINKIAEDGIAAADERALIGRLGDLMERSGTGSTVAFTNWVRELSGVRLGPKADLAEASQAIIKYLQPKMRTPGSGASSDKDVQIFGQSLPSLLSTPEGRRVIIETLGGMATARQERGDIAMRVQIGEFSAKEAIAEMRKLGDPFAAFRDWQGVKEGRGGRQAPEVKPPEVGDVLDGFRFNGGNAADPANWEKVK